MKPKSLRLSAKCSDCQADPLKQTFVLQNMNYLLVMCGLPCTLIMKKVMRKSLCFLSWTISFFPYVKLVNLSLERPGVGWKTHSENMQLTEKKIGYAPTNGNSELKRE